MQYGNLQGSFNLCLFNGLLGHLLSFKLPRILVPTFAPQSKLQVWSLACFPGIISSEKLINTRSHVQSSQKYTFDAFYVYSSLESGMIIIFHRVTWRLYEKAPQKQD